MLGAWLFTFGDMEGGSELALCIQWHWRRGTTDLIKSLSDTMHKRQNQKSVLMQHVALNAFAAEESK